MANPQPTKFVRISTELFEALCRIRIPGEARQILDTIIRKTYGWNKTEDRISLSQFHLATGLHKPNISRALKKLMKMNLVIRIDNPSGFIYRYNKDYSTWRGLSNRQPVARMIKGGYQNAPKKVINQTTTIDTTIDTNTIDSRAVLYEDILSHLNSLLKTQYRHTTTRTRQLILARWREGFRLDDFKKVHKTMLDEWGADEKMSKYLRPETLYGTKFEGYLNRKPSEKSEEEARRERLRKSGIKC